jgi:lysophospholipase L1-like esterase
VLAGCGRETPELPPLDPSAEILAFGNSLTHGTGASAEASYPAVLADRLGRDVINAGKPGEVSGDGRRRLPGVLDETEPDLVLLCHGGNDFLQDNDPEDVRDNLTVMVRQARERDIPVVLIGVPGRSLSLSTSPIYAKVAAAMDLVLVEDAVASILGDSELRSDRIHPNADGYRRLAEAVHEKLVEAGAVDRP